MRLIFHGPSGVVSNSPDKAANSTAFLDSWYRKVGTGQPGESPYITVQYGWYRIARQNRKGRGTGHLEQDNRTGSTTGQDSQTGLSLDRVGLTG